MIALITDSVFDAVDLKAKLIDSDIFVYSMKHSRLSSERSVLSAVEDPGAEAELFTVHSSKGDLSETDKCLAILKRNFPEVICIASVLKAPKISMYKYLENSDRELLYSGLDDLADRLIELAADSLPKLQRKHSFLELSSPGEAYFLGFPFRLTKAEYRILLFLCQRTNSPSSARLLLGCCFPEGYRMTETNIRSHISSINRKAIFLGGRKLILNERGKGYMLNKFM